MHDEMATIATHQHDAWSGLRRLRNVEPPPRTFTNRQHARATCHIANLAHGLMTMI